ncbi:hypothetical protein GW755_00115 [bacterium]|nr:hypothetical protein [bacterium]
MAQNKKQFYVKITNPEGLVYGGNAVSVSSTNVTGPFDVLYMHTNFITIIKDKLTLRTPEGSIKEYTLDTGILRAVENMIDVYLGIEVY